MMVKIMIRTKPFCNNFVQPLRNSYSIYRNNSLGRRRKDHTTCRNKLRTLLNWLSLIDLFKSMRNRKRLRTHLKKYKRKKLNQWLRFNLFWSNQRKFLNSTSKILQWKGLTWNWMIKMNYLKKLNIWGTKNKTQRFLQKTMLLNLTRKFSLQIITFLEVVKI